jgi:hypothetical protein
MVLYQDCPVVVQEADIPGPGMSVDTTIKWVLMGVESHVRSPLSLGVCPKVSIPSWYAEGEASIIIKGVQPTASSVRLSLAPASGSG